jgi:hypothetical protein
MSSHMSSPGSMSSKASSAASSKASSAASNASNGSNNEEESKTRLSKFSTCVRQVAATAPYKRKLLFNSPEEDTKITKDDLSMMSSKFKTLLDTITQLDAEDMETHGTKFKHFIFTDVRNGAYGAKAIASYLAAHQFSVLFKTEKGFRRRKVKNPNNPKAKATYKMVPTKKLKITLGSLEPVLHGSNRVGLLQSAPLWKSQLSVEIRKKMMSTFNSRPDNVHGEQIRIMILDSKFKEGIDLYDVKYVHLMEPQITEADLKQAVGRATRFCGQRGLKFVPSVGWKLHVMLYDTEFAEEFPFAEKPTGARFNAHKYIMDHSGMDLGLLELTKNLTVEAIKSAVDYDLTYKVNNFQIQSEIFNLADLEESVALSVSPQTGKVSVVAESVKGLNLEKCMPRSNKLFPFSVKKIQEALKAKGIRIPAKATRKDMCTLLEAHKGVQLDLMTGRIVKAKSVEPAAHTLFPEGIHPEPAVIAKSVMEMPDLADFFGAHEMAAEMHAVAKHSSFAKFQEFVMEKYARFQWDAPVIKSACDTVPPQGKAVQFSKSQDFIRHYLTPDSPFRGLLAWHSVGTGKTCTAIAAATTEFEKRGYSILWVTRNSLMADVWKNMFGSVCSIPVQEHLAAGKKLPTAKGAQRKLIGSQWFDPISYRTLQNALVPPTKGPFKGKLNKLGLALRDKNSQKDPLANTFLIIDEVHKLMDGDLKASEMADFETIQAAIHNSYKVSGDHSVKVLLMTATPITDNPEGLFRLLNLLIPSEKDRLPSLETFREKYTTAEGSMTPAGIAYFQSKTKGLISYLNREFDPSTFAQPEFHVKKIVASGADLLSDEDLLNKCLEDEKEEKKVEVIECDVDGLKAELQDALSNLDEALPKKQLADRKRTLKAEYKQRIDSCKAALKATKETLRNRVRTVKACVGTEARTRKRTYRFSQQKAAKKCFKKNPLGETRKFTGVGELKREAGNRLGVKTTQRKKKTNAPVPVENA